MAECKLVLFDCDGTLIDSEPITCAVENEILGELGAKMETSEFIARFMGTSKKYIASVVLEEFGVTLPDDYAKRVDDRLHERLWREAKGIEGVHAMLDALDQPRAVCSNADIKKLKIEMQRTELWDRFRPYVFSAYDLDPYRPKPAPDLYLHAAQQFEIEPKHCVVVEDSSAGVQAGRAAGMRVIGFAGGSHCPPGHADTLTEAGADTVLTRLADIPSTIKALEAWAGI